MTACGWQAAADLCQHDVSEAFTFITETLQLPLLSLKMDLYHFGKEDEKDDHKIVRERLLELAIPEQRSDGHDVKLEDCLELYFNNRIEVKRYLEEIERRNTLGSAQSDSVGSTKAQAVHYEVKELDISQPSSPVPQSVPGDAWPSRPHMQRLRAPSLIQEYYVDEKRGFLKFDKDGKHPRLRREVTMPAWQFFRLIPFYTENEVITDEQAAAHFSTDRPILGICLKRYGIHPNGIAFKKRTHIDIPLEMGLPHFITGDEAEPESDDSRSDKSHHGDFKLLLQSVVCHRGVSTDSGHYISLVRSPNSASNGEDQWMRFDDLANERVVNIAIDDWLNGEATPYLLFYQVIPIECGSSKIPNQS